MAGNISCALCDCTFAQKNGYNRHLKKFHPYYENERNSKTNIKCPLCKISCFSIINLQEHIQTAHVDVKLSIETKTFYSFDEFSDWKMKMERETQSSFVKHRADHTLANGKIAMRYYCHRSGNFTAQTPRRRRLKVLGSLKIGYTCPAYIFAYKETYNEAVEITVKYQSVHIGHECNIERIQLTTEEKEKLARSLSFGLSKTTILKNIKKSYPPTERISRTTRKDLHNICRTFKIDDEYIFHQNDALSVDIRVKKMLNDDEISILIYKPIGELLQEYPAITKEEFILGIMNRSQLKLLEIYGNDVVMIDSIQYGLQLTTLLIQVGRLEGFPIAIFFSTRVEAETFFPLFSAIKKQLPTLKPNVFMSDDTPAFYNAFKTVFGEVPQQLICAWHVRRAWNANLNSKIKNKSVQKNVKIHLENILKETDMCTFEKLLDAFLKNVVSREDAIAFGDYFLDNYVNRVDQWAYCYHKNAHYNTNMKVEQWHREIKYEERCGKSIKRLDKSLGIVLGAVSKKLIGRAIALESGKLDTKKIEIRKRHDYSKNIASNMVTELTPKLSWIVLTNKSANLDTYVVSYEKECHCAIRCDECNVCIHQFSCTCHDYAIKFIMCKHIHFVCQNYAFGNSTNDGSTSEDNYSNLGSDIEGQCSPQDSEIESQCLPQSSEIEGPCLSQSFNIEEERIFVISELQNLIQICQSANISFEQWQTLKKSILSLKSQLISTPKLFPLQRNIADDFSDLIRFRK